MLPQLPGIKRLGVGGTLEGEEIIASHKSLFEPSAEISAKPICGVGVPVSG